MNTTDHLIPRPSHVAPQDGPAFTLSPGARIAAGHAAAQPAEQLAALLRTATALHCRWLKNTAQEISPWSWWIRSTAAVRLTH